MSRRLWIDPTFGASGDMLLGALAGLAGDEHGDADEPIAALAEALGRLDVDGWRLERAAVIRGGIAATRVAVTAETGPARHWSDIDAMLATAPLPPTVVAGARRTFRRLGEVEAAQHGVDLDQVHFHEVGAVDAIVDIVGVWWLLDRLDVDGVVSGPVGLGHGTVRAAHGLLPVPAPATAELLRDAPVRALDAPFETCTPTGAALLATIGRWGAIPDGRIAAIGRGAGGRDPDTHPNVVTAILLDDAIRAAHPDDGHTEAAIVLASNVDDATPEVLAHTVDALLRAGADDAWITPITMKKGRPAHQVNALAGPSAADAVRAVLAAETGTLGIRAATVTKHVAPRRIEVVTVRGHEVRVKIGPHGAKPEHDDLVAVSEVEGVPVRRLAVEALAALS